MYRVVQKMAQSLWHHNFATVHHTVLSFLNHPVLSGRPLAFCPFQLKTGTPASAPVSTPT